jgi:hypothetical protein
MNPETVKQNLSDLINYKTQAITSLVVTVSKAPPQPNFLKINFNHTCLVIFAGLHSRATRVQRSIVPLATQANLQIKHF